METKRNKKRHMISIDFSKEMSHGICVSNLAYKVGKELMLSDEMCYNLAVMGFLHDVGKQEMFKNVRKKGLDDVLNVEEMRYIKTHPVLGYSILKEFNYDPKQIEWVLYHHENYDGTGYPANKAGEDIPLGARILRVCDVFAALTADRSYRKAYTVDQAMEQMVSEVKNFDMKVFMALMNVVHKYSEKELLDQQNILFDLTDEKLTKLNRRHMNELEKETGNRYEGYLPEGDGDS